MSEARIEEGNEDHIQRDGGNAARVYVGLLIICLIQNFKVLKIVPHWILNKI